MLAVLLYDQGLREQRFYELNPSAEGRRGLHYVSQHMVDPSYFLGAALIGLFLYAVFKFSCSNYTQGLVRPIAINAGKVILGSIAIFLVLLFHSFFTGMITQ